MDVRDPLLLEEMDPLPLLLPSLRSDMLISALEEQCIYTQDENECVS